MIPTLIERGESSSLETELFKLLNSSATLYLHDIPLAKDKGINLEMRSQDRNKFYLFMIYNGSNFNIGNGSILPPTISLNQRRQEGMPIPYSTLFIRIREFYTELGFLEGR